MAEFQEVARHWKRMCDKHWTSTSCHGCPIAEHEQLYEACASIGINVAKMEELVMSWAAEHPEPVYPTWIEWLKKFGIISFEPDFHSLLSAYPTRTNSVKAYINEEGGKPIPAVIAQKLDIEPKEG